MKYECNNCYHNCIIDTKITLDYFSKKCPFKHSVVKPEWKLKEKKLSPIKFINMLNKRQIVINKTLGDKAKEYAFKGDRLYNFNQAAKINNTTPAKALWGMATKHLVSIQDLINNRLENTEKNVNEKIGDMINYLILLEGVLSTTRQKTIKKD